MGVAVRPLSGLFQRSSPISSAEVGGESETYFETAAARPHKKSAGAPTSANVETFCSGRGKAHGHEQQTLNASASQNAISNMGTQEMDAKSDTSFDPLFDDEPDPDGDGDNNAGGDGGADRAKACDKESAAPGSYVGLAVPDVGGSDPGLQGQQAGRSSQSSVAPPKNAPPLLSAENSSTFSADVLMISAIDGQIMLWDKRVNTPGKGVGRLWLSEKTPPWCVSVRTRSWVARLMDILADCFTGVLVDGWITDLRRTTKRDGGCVGCSVAGTEWTGMHAPAGEEPAQSRELRSGIVCGAVS